MGTLYEAFALACGVLAVTIWFDYAQTPFWARALISVSAFAGYIEFNHLAQQAKKKEARRHGR